MELGLVLPASEPSADGLRRLSFDRILAVAERADRLGFHSLWWFDHFFVEATPGRRTGSFECWTLLSAIATQTSRAFLGSLVLCNSPRQAALVAKRAASLQEISNGRVLLGLGASWHERCGLMMSSSRSRRERQRSGSPPPVNACCV